MARFVPIVLLPRIAICLAAVAAGAFAGCSSDGQVTDAGAVVSHDANFEKCLDTPAVPYMAGWAVASMSGAYVATLVSATTEPSPTSPGFDHPEVGFGDWVVAISDAAGGAAAADVTLTAEKPWMPRHGHGASTFPAVTPGDPGMFTVLKIDFFMAGYWEVNFDLQPATGTEDKVTYAICIPS